MGFATISCQYGQPCIKVGTTGVQISGILLQAGSTSASSLLSVGYDFEPHGDSDPYSFLHDVFARVGGPSTDETAVDIMVQVNNNNVIIDNTWLWRADHDIAGKVYDKRNHVNTSLQVNGNNVIGYGIMCEHTLRNNLEWNGENGRTYFYQNELPYEIDNDFNGFYGYKVGDHVQNHEAWGTGVYAFFRDHNALLSTAISAPENPGIKFHNSMTKLLGHNNTGTVQHIIDHDGEAINKDQTIEYLCEWSGHAKDAVLGFLQY